MGKLGKVLSLARQIKTEQGVCLVTQFYEIFYLYVSRGLGPLLYFEASLWRRDLSLAEKKRFMNAAQYSARIDQLNPREYRKFAQHKLAEKSLLTLMGFPTPAFIGFYSEEGGSDTKGISLDTLDSLEVLLCKYENHVVCFKMAEGWGGEGFTAAKISKTAEGLILENLAVQGKRYLLADFFSEYLQDNVGKGLLIEEYFYQHQILSQFHSSSLNTLRIWATKNRNDIEILGAVLRLGRDNQVIDNASQGGLIVNIDLDTGKLEELTDTGILRVAYKVHPSTGCQIEGVELPHWEACINLSKRALAAFPGMRFVGLDMAIGPDGPVIVELNPEPDRKSARNFGRPLTDLLSD
ncbi:MAG: sugar-transfer associated ATP-grasp domain-containing protein [Porticoccus sp.]|nr:sugar-transfer associated ATP-grasp domain-containing protein [Porticoccus sp.]